MNQDFQPKKSGQLGAPETVLRTLPVRRALLNREYRERVSELLQDCKYQVNSVISLDTRIAELHPCSSVFR
jgi:hypothetical protein